ncbi:hypothetical protein TNCV_33121 [Trichonephila clavipes]|nr:hypothetical protein TNCV_33121 [Trichonephila clavipes]
MLLSIISITFGIIGYVCAESVPDPDEIGNLIEEVVNLAKQINLEVDIDGIYELLDFHNQELTIHEFIEKHEQEQDIDELKTQVHQLRTQFN